MIWYYPLTVFALLSFAMAITYTRKQTYANSSILSQFRKDPARSLILTGILLNILFYVIIIGNNYLGGDHAIGNRLFYIFPAFLFLIGKIDIKVLIPVIIIALFTVVPVIADPIMNSQLPETHTYRIPYRFFPLEYSQINNLPIWIHRHPYANYTIYDMDWHSSFTKSFTVVNGTSHWLIKTVPNNQNLSFIIFTKDASKKQTFHISESHSITTIEGTDAEMVTVFLNHPVYENAGYRIYSLYVNSTPDVFIIPSRDINNFDIDIRYQIDLIRNRDNISIT